MKKILVFILFFFFLSIVPAFAQENSFAPEEIIVKFTPNTSVSQISKLNQKFKSEIKSRLNLPESFVLKVPAGSEAILAKIFSSLPNVEFAEPNYEMHALVVSNDTYLSQQWGLLKIQAPLAWDKTTGNPSVKIAIVDTGIDKDHPDLSAKVDSWVNFSSTSSSDDLFGHGTHVAGIAAAITNNNIGVAGVGYDSHLLSVKVLNDSGSGYTSWIVNGITWAADNGAKVINLSLGGSSPSKTLENAINYAWNKGVVLSCAAGNNGNTSASYPAYYQNCIAVAGTDQNDQKASWSTYGSWVDVAAPGLDILSTLPNHKARMTSTRNYGTASGTSMATPFVSGLAGLLFSENPGMTNSQVRSIIENSTDKISGTGSYWAFGRINAAVAVSGIEIPTATPTLVVQPTDIPTLAPSPIPTSTPIPTTIPTKIPTPTPTPTTLTPTPTPWWCRYFPSQCQ